MIMRDEWVVCPICHVNLPLERLRQDGKANCQQCGRYYTYSHGVFDFTPSPPADEDVKKVWHIWEDLQKNGLVSYEQDPEHNLSVEQRKDVQAFANFCQLSGLTLDLGCGPQRSIPGYAQRVSESYIGLDPLLGVQPRDFTFFKGVAEYLPFRSGIFQHVLYATSLDHMLNPERALAETKRVLHPRGVVNLWFYDATRQPSRWEVRRAIWQARWQAAKTLVRQGKTHHLLKSVVTLTPFRSSAESNVGGNDVANQPEYLTALAVPDGAIDHFHFFHPTQTDVYQWLQAAGLQVTRVQVFELHHIFIQAAHTVGA